MQLTADLSNLPHDMRLAFRDRLASEHDAKIAVGKANQLRAAKQYRETVSTGTTKDGFGPVSMIIDPTYRACLKLQYGDECFNDPEWVKWFIKQTPEAVVRQVGTRIQVGYAPATGSKFRKKYPQ